jgi:hypothetical protein
MSAVPDEQDKLKQELPSTSLNLTLKDFHSMASQSMIAEIYC